MTTELRKRLIGRFLLKPAAGLAIYGTALLAAGAVVQVLIGWHVFN